MENRIPVPQEQLQPETINPYKNSEIVSSLLTSYKEGNPLRIAFTDIDSTFTGTPEEQKAAYEALTNAGYRIVYVTSRTPEMTIGSESAQKSVEFNRPAPKLQKNTTATEGTIDAIRDAGGEFSTAYPDQVPSFVGIYDGDATLASTGSEIWIRQTDGSYRLDQEFETKMQVDKDRWRQETRSKIDAVNESVGSIAQYAPLEDISNFNEGRMDVAPPDLRFQMNFDSLEEQITFTKQMNAVHPEIQVIEDGKPSEGRFQIYMAPVRAGKQRAVEDFFRATLTEINAQLPEEQEVSAQDFETIFIGDSWPDVPMGLYSALGSNATLLLVGGSRMIGKIGNTSEEGNMFATEGLQALNKRVTKVEEGIYEFATPIFGTRKIVTGEAYPGTKAPTTISAHMNATR